jgi:hypothetical protein
MKKNTASQSAFFNPRIFTAFLFCSAAVWMAMLSFATITPPGGTLTDSSGPITFTGGPYAVPNPSSQATGTPTCNAVLVCDEYTLTVSGLSAATTASQYIRVQVAWQELGEAQFDLYVFSGTSATGQLIATSIGNMTYVDPDVVLIPAINGTYTIRVVPFNPQTLSITGTVSLVPFPVVAPVTPGTPPSFSNHVSPSGLGNSAGEPSVGVDWNPNLASLKHDSVNTGGVTFFTAGTQQLRVSFNDATSPPVALWEDAAAPVQTGLDPIGFVDHQTGRVFGLELATGDSNAAYSDDDGATWQTFVAGGVPAGPDHETFGGGPYNYAAVPPPPPPNPLYPNAVYYCSQNIAGGAECSRSDNGGLTFGPGVDIYSVPECYGGIHGHVKVGPDGSVYVPNSSCSAGTGSQGVSVSLDNGLTWTDYTVPNSTGSGDPSVGIGSDNTVYLGYVNGDGRPHIAVSTNHGQTWTNDWEVGQPVGCAGGDQYAACRIKSAVFPAVVAGDGDRAAFGFLGSTDGGNYQDLATFQGIWNFYVATTYDRGAHWVTVNATAGDPVQKGAICLAGILCSSGNRNLLDFNDISVDKEGRSIGAYADGCVAPPIGTCTAPNYSGRAKKAAIVRQLTGRRLFAAADGIAVCPPLPFIDDLEPAQLPGWTFEVAQNAFPASSTWALMTDPNAHSLYHSFFSDASASANATKDDRLIAPPQKLSATSHLIFWHQFQFEDGFDGGVLEVSTDNGATWVDVLDGGGSFISGGYNGTIDATLGSPIAGRPAWTFISDAAPMMNRVEVNLGAFAGNGVLVRWRLALDDISLQPGVGWWVDDVEFTNLACDIPPTPTLVVSRFTHGAVTPPPTGPGDISLTLPVGASPRAVEPRSSASLGAGNYQLVFTFPNTLTSVTGASVTGHNPANGTGSVSGAPIMSGNTCTVNLTNVSNAQYIQVTLTGVADIVGSSGDVLSPELGILIGDVNGNGVLTNADVSLVKAQVAAGGSVTTSNFRDDVNANGVITNADVSVTKAQVAAGTQLPSTP